MKKPTPEKYWNHRIVTHLIKYKELYPDNKAYANREDERLFSITEVHYENGKPVACAEGLNILKDHDSVKALRWTSNKIKEAFKKPVLDADNWPNDWHES